MNLTLTRPAATLSHRMGEGLGVRADTLQTSRLERPLRTSVIAFTLQFCKPVRYQPMQPVVSRRPSVCLFGLQPDGVCCRTGLQGNQNSRRI